jgi:transaldolase
MTLAQVREIRVALNPATPSYVSVLAGRIADTGIDPLPLMAQVVEILKGNANAELVWASSRELRIFFRPMPSVARSSPYPMTYWINWR